MEEQDLILKKKENLSKLPQYRGEVPSKNMMVKLPNIRQGEILWIENENAAYVISQIKKGKVIVKKLDDGATLSTGFTLYDLNKSAVRKEKPLDLTNEEVKEELIDTINNYLQNNYNNIYLCYGRETHFFTIFKRTEEPLKTKMGKDILDTLIDYGDIISIENNNDDNTNQALEIWIKINDEPTLFMLFGFDKGIVEIG